jgi:hypothetical protein
VSFVQIFTIITFALFSFVDLRSRFVPFIDIFFVLTGIFVFAESPWHVLTLAMAVIWGSFERIPARLVFPLVFYPLAWPILLVGFGVRRKMIGKADLFAIGTIGFLFPISAVIAALIGFEFWRRWWVGRGNCGYIPAIPGMFLGLAVHSIVQVGMQILDVFPG